MIARIGPVRQVLARRPVLPGPVTPAVRIRMASVVPPTASAPGEQAPGLRSGGPDTPVFSLDDGTPLAELGGRYLSTQVAGGFTGRVVGMYVTEGTAAFDWFEYVPGDGSASR
ncbi:hypothetical protein [Streptomyces bullii]|uniref:Beta-xylosidase C-terminal Concanavalin A-like domain-containing protein n=1 Tax=Streptomyces bullii TaxID=349910 RepID=A0ABW0UN19_9ACTN